MLLFNLVVYIPLEQNSILLWTNRVTPQIEGYGSVMVGPHMHIFGLTFSAPHHVGIYHIWFIHVKSSLSPPA